MSRKSRDHPKMSLLDVLITVGAILALLTVLSLVGSLGGLFGESDQTPGSSAGNENTDTVPGENETPGEDEPTVPEEPELVGRGSGKYAASSGVLTYEYEGDTSADGYDVGFDRTVADVSDNSALTNHSKPVTVDGDGAWEIAKSGIEESTANIASFSPINKTGATFVAETDIKWGGSSGLYRTDTTPYVMCFNFISTNGEKIIIFGFDNEDGDLSLGYRAGVDDSLVTIPRDEWTNLRIEVDDSYVTFYVNGKATGQTYVFWFLTNQGPMTGDFSSFELETRYYAKDILLQLDNTYVSAIN